MKAIVRPSRDQSGLTSSAGEFAVRFRWSVPSGFIVQMSRLPGAVGLVRTKATLPFDPVNVAPATGARDTRVASTASTSAAGAASANAAFGTLLMTHPPSFAVRVRPTSFGRRARRVPGEDPGTSARDATGRQGPRWPVKAAHPGTAPT